MKRKNRIWLDVLSCVVSLTGLGQQGWAAPPHAAEHPVREIPLAGKLVEVSGGASAEVSGLAWYGDHLIILPQYPSRFVTQGKGRLFTIPKMKILDFVDGKATAAITPDEIRFDALGVSGFLDGFQGYEAIAFHDTQAFLAVELKSLDPKKGGAMGAFVVAAAIEPDLSELRLTPPHLSSIPLQTKVPNMAVESILVVNDTLVALHEANGGNVNTHPVGHIFNMDLRPVRTIEFPAIEYRITDATAPDAQGRFWCINYFYPGDADKLDPAADTLAAKHGQGPSHAKRQAVERLVEFQYTDATIKLTETPPIQLELLEDGTPRNWEGIARLDDRGFLLMTDQYPRTILAFVSLQ